MGALIFENEIGKFLRKQNSREAPCVRMRDNGSLVIPTPSNSNFAIVQRKTGKLPSKYERRQFFLNSSISYFFSPIFSLCQQRIISELTRA